MNLPRPILLASIAAAVTLPIALAGCGGGDTAVSTTPTVLTKQQAAKEYLKVVATRNRLGRAWANHPVTAANAVENERAFMAADDAQARAIAAVKWPAEVRPTMMRFVRDLAALHVLQMDVVNAKTQTAAWMAENSPALTAAQDKTVADASEARILLGLPSIKK